MQNTDSLPCLVTATGRHALHLRCATGFLSRLRGLMLAPPLAPDAAVLLTHCNAIHTCFMRQAIDVLYLDAAGTVVRCVSALAAWRCSLGDAGRTGARHVVELRAGSIARWQVACGDRLDHALFADRE